MKIPFHRISVTALFLLVSLSLLSLFVVFQNANNEPYVRFRWIDAMEQIGLGILVLIGWMVFVIAVLRGVLNYVLSLWWLAALPWVLIAFYFVGFAIDGYVNDLETFGNDPAFEVVLGCAPLNAFVFLRDRELRRNGH